MAVYAGEIRKLEQYLSYFSQVDRLGVFEKILQSLVEISRKYFLVEIARFINTPPEHAKFWEIKISGCHAEEKTTKFMLSLIFNLSAFL